VANSAAKQCARVSHMATMWLLLGVVCASTSFCFCEALHTAPACFLHPVMPWRGLGGRAPVAVRQREGPLLGSAATGGVLGVRAHDAYADR
jgi:hypothetical protein